MSTLETQYRKFLEANQKLKLSFEEWKKVNARLVKQALINMMKDDEELGLYDEPKQNWYHDGKIIDGKQERIYSEQEAGELVYNIIGQYAKHYDIMIDGAKLNELFEQFKKK